MSGAGPGAGRSGRIQSLERAAAILDAAAARPDGISLAELSAATGLHTSTAFHLVRTLVALQFIAQGADKRYRIGSRLFALAAGALDESALLALANPVLERLSAETGEAAHLAVRAGGEIIIIARTAATGLLQLSGRTGSTRPAHATAIGKALLAALQPDELDAVLADLPLPALTPRTITDAETLRRELDDVRRSGVAHDDRELDPDVRCMAMLVRDFAGRAVAAIGVSGPTWRFAEDAATDRLARLAAAAEALSAKLGRRPD